MILSLLFLLPLSTSLTIDQLGISDFQFPQTNNSEWNSFSLTPFFTFNWQLETSNCKNKSSRSTTSASWWIHDRIHIILSFQTQPAMLLPTWFAVGFGSSTMLFSDILQVTAPKDPFASPKRNDSMNNNIFAVHDATILTTGVIYDKRLSGGANDYTVGDCNSNKNGITCYTTRKLYTGDANDCILKPGPIPMIFAYGDAPGNHGPLNRGNAIIDLLNCDLDYLGSYIGKSDPFGDRYLQDGMVKAALPRRKQRSAWFYAVHVASMLIIWVLVIPVGIYLAKDYGNGLNPKDAVIASVNWLVMHKAVMGIGLTENLTMVMSSVATGNGMVDSNHGKVGLAVSGSMALAAVMGYLASNMISQKYLRLCHKITGALVGLAGITNCVFGFQLLFTGSSYYFYISCGVMGFWLIVLALLWKFHLLIPMIKQVIVVRRIGMKIWELIIRKKKSDKKKEDEEEVLLGPNQRLPLFTMTQYQKLVEEDKQPWVHLDNQIFSVRGFQHPGGKEILAKYYGRDITPFFMRVEGKRTGSMTKNTTASMNSFAKDRSHIHSRLALFKLQTMVVATLTNDSGAINKSNVLEESIRQLPGIEKELIGKLKEMRELSPNLFYLKVSLTQEFPSPFGSSFLLFADETTRKHYTPIKTSKVFIKELEFIIKINEKGFTKERLLPFIKGRVKKIGVDGPAFYYQDQPVLFLERIKERKSQLFLISGGSGVTPLLQLLHFLEHLSPSDEGYSLGQIPIHWISTHNNSTEQKFIQSFVKKPVVSSLSFYLAKKESGATESPIVVYDKFSVQSVKQLINPSSDGFMICAGSVFMEQIVNDLKELEIPDESIFLFK